MHVLWLVIKILLSVLLIALAVGMLLVAPAPLSDPAVLGGAALFLFFAALPWLNFTRPTRPLGFAGIVFSLVFYFIVARVISGEITFPKACGGRRWLYCYLENHLYSFGGRYLAVAPIFIIATLFLIGSVVLITRTHLKNTAA